MGTTRKGATNHPSKVVAKAMALLAAGESVSEVSRQLHVPVQTVSDWKAQLPPEIGQIRTKGEIIEDLLSQYLEAILKVNIAQLNVFADPEWVRQQNAGDLAILHGVLFDKAVRIFDAARRGEQMRQIEQGAFRER